MTTSWETASEFLVFYDFVTKSIQNHQNLEFLTDPSHKMWEQHCKETFPHFVWTVEGQLKILDFGYSILICKQSYKKKNPEAAELKGPVYIGGTTLYRGQ